MFERELGKEYVRSGACKEYGDKSPPAAKKVREFAAQVGLNLEQHRAISLSHEDCAWADLILYMDNGNYERMKELIPEADLPKAKCLATYIGKDRLPDPAFTARGAMLEKLLTWVVLAAEACARQLKKKDPAVAGSEVRQGESV